MEQLREKALLVHRQAKGKLSVELEVPVVDMNDLSVIYSPGVAEPCKEISANLRRSSARHERAKRRLGETNKQGAPGGNAR
ncbi:hypothetical protein B4114_1309 [Geobacillus stearothermophilus]|uniref:Malic enzyme N-terminal domain-containing protein n=1 Tax=Geobacillus stearothermophilus TaxID=1422 RepID=A0A150NAZ1_GEOSE|nr:hypothetical protein B4114_1309 [Geobacillus stearothermophilus]